MKIKKANIGNDLVRFRGEMKARLASVAGELLREFKCWKSRDDLTDEQLQKWFSGVVAEEVGFYENLLIAIKERAIEEARECRGSFNATARNEFRHKNIRVSGAYGNGCAVCHGGSDTPALMTLSIGNVYGRLLLDFCRPCAERLASVVDARLDDKRRSENRS